jgi:aryl-alcohol dehydrogenase-like predicted oxidoreductase
MTSSSIAQGKILGRLPESFELLAPGEADSVKALNYVRSAPGVAVALCGMKETKHVIENIKLALMPRVSPEMMAALF